MSDEEILEKLRKAQSHSQTHKLVLLKHITYNSDYIHALNKGTTLAEIMDTTFPIPFVYLFFCLVLFLSFDILDNSVPLVLCKFPVST